MGKPRIVKIKTQEEGRSPKEQKGRLMRGRREMPSHLNRRSGDLEFPTPLPAEISYHPLL